MKKLRTMIATVATAFGLCTSIFADVQRNWFNETPESVQVAMLEGGETLDGVWSNLTDQVAIIAAKVAVDADDETPVAYRPKTALRGDSASITLAEIKFDAERKTLPALDAGTQAAVAITTNAEGNCVFAVANGGAWEVTAKSAAINGIYKVKVDFHYGDTNTVDYSLDEADQWTVLKTGALNPATEKVSTVELAGNGSFVEMSGERELVNYTISFTEIPAGIAEITVDGTPVQDGTATVAEGAENVVIGFVVKPGYRVSPETKTIQGPIFDNVTFAAKDYPEVGEIPYVAQIIRDDVTNKFEALQAALDDAAANEVIEVLSNIDDVDITVSNKVTISATDFTLTGKAQTYTVKIVTGGALTVSGGNYLTEAETTHSLFLVGNDASVEGGTDATGSLTISSGTFGGAKVGNLVKVSKGNAELSGGIFNQTGGSRAIKADGPNARVNVTGAGINADGKIAYAADNGGQIAIDGGLTEGNIQLEGTNVASKITILDGTIDGEILRKGGTAKGTILIPHDSTADFDRDQTAWCVAGYKTKKNEQDRYTVIAIQCWTVTIDTVANCTIAVTNGETGVVSGETFDRDLTTVLKVTRTPAEGYELDGCAAYEEITLAGDTNITAAVKKAVTPGPIWPGHSSLPYETREAAAADAAKTEIKPVDDFELTGEALAMWQGYFVNQVYQDGDGKYRFAPVLNAAGSNAVAQAEATLTKAIKVADIAAATEAIATMELTGAEPGFYYTLFKSDDVTTVLEGRDKGNSDKKAKADGIVTFTNVMKPSDAAGFFSVKVSAQENYTDKD